MDMQRAPSGSGVVPLHAAVRGRVRLRVPGLRRSPALKRRLEAELMAMTAVRRASADPWTGNVVVLHEPQTTPDRIIRRIEELLGLADPAEAGGEPADGAPAWHELPAAEAMARLGSSAEAGLSGSAATSRLERHGPNALPEPRPRSGLCILLGQLSTLPVGLLGAAAVVSLATGGTLDAAVILGVIALNGGIGTVTESAAERAIRALTLPRGRTARVVRDGHAQAIPAPSVVPGDMLVLEPGTLVAADARVIAVRGLTANEAPLTGESAPLPKTPGPLRRGVPLAERTNMVYAGTTITDGAGRAAVVATGAATEMGRIQALVSQARAPETPLQRQLGRLGRELAWLSGAVCGVVFLAGLARGYGLLQMARTAISLAVAAIPEGLPTLATVALALGAEDMRRRKVLIRRLGAVETLAALKVICFDKTGTLTLNRMSVAALASRGRTYRATDSVLTDPRGRPIRLAAEADLAHLLAIAVLCNETELGPTRSATDLDGSPTEAALVRVALDAGIDVAGLRAAHPRVALFPRSESSRFMLTRHVDGTNRLSVAVKGSPRDVLALCDRCLDGGAARLLTAADRASIVRQNRRMAAEALRVLGLAYGDAAPAATAAAEDAPPTSLVWAGLVGMADPLRHGMAELMAAFHDAGIQTVMMTGDQSATARAVARRSNLGAGRRIEVVDWPRLESLPAPALEAVARGADVFARVTPAQKLRVIRVLQRAGRVVAMAGDGINDSPALKAADVGVALGASGTDAAREVADVVLEDDQLAAMITAIERGRTTYANIGKGIRFLLSTNLSEVMVMLVLTATGLGRPLTPLQLLWINLASDVLPAVGLALEPPEPGVLRHPPRGIAGSVLRGEELGAVAGEATMLSAGALAACGFGLLRHGAGARTGTLTFGSLIIAQLLHAITCRSPTSGLFGAAERPPNRALTGALAAAFLLQGAAFLVPGLRRVLGLVAIDALDGAVMLAAGTLPFLVNEAAKLAPSRSAAAGSSPA